LAYLAGDALRLWQGAVIEYIADAYGPEPALDLPQAIVRNDTLDAALQDALGVGLEQFEPGWPAWLAARFGKDTD